MAATVLEKEIEAAVRKAIVDEAAAKAIQIILSTPSGAKMIERIAHDQALEFVRNALGRNLLSESEAKSVEDAFAKHPATSGAPE